MNVQSLLDDVENSAPFKAWRAQNPQHSFLVSLFAQVEDEKPIAWHVNYYMPGTEMCTTFTTHPEIELAAVSELAAKNPKELDSQQATISFPEILERAVEAFSSSYPNFTYSKLLVTLHQEEQATWAINFLTNQAQTVNIRLSAQTSEVISSKLFSLKDISAPEE